MADEINTANLQMIQAKVAAYVLEKLPYQSIMRQLIQMQSIKRGEGTMSKFFRKRGSLTASIVAESGSVARQGYAETKVTVTLSKAIVRTAPSEEVSRYSDEDEIDKLKRLSLDAIARKEDGDIMNLFTGFSQTAGTTNTVLSVATINQGEYLLNLNEEDIARGLVLHPKQAKDLKNEIIAAAATIYASGTFQTITNFATGRGFIGTLGGVPVFQSALVKTANAGVDRCGAFLTSDAIALLYDDEISYKEAENLDTWGKDMGLAKFYGLSELADTAGIGLISKAA